MKITVFTSQKPAQQFLPESVLFLLPDKRYEPVVFSRKAVVAEGYALSAYLPAVLIFDKKIYFFCGDDEGRELVGNGRNAVFGKKSFHVDNERNADSDNGSFQGVGGEFTFRVINAASRFDTVVGELNGATESFAFSAGKRIHRYN